MTTQTEKNLDPDSPAAELANALNVKMEEIFHVIYDAAEELTKERSVARKGQEAIEREDQIVGNLFFWYVDADITMNERMIVQGLIRLDIDAYITKMHTAGVAIARMSTPAVGARIMVRLQHLEERVKNLQKMASD